MSDTALSAIEVILITGMSGSGKSVALHALEDAGYYCVDNLPPELLASFIALEQQQGVDRIGIAMDVRSATSLPLVPRQWAQLREQGIRVKTVFLDSTTETLVHRFSETRRNHPLSTQKNPDQRRDLIDAIEMERGLLGELRNDAHVIDTSLIRSSQLQSYIKELISSPSTQMTLVFESFGFKRGIPLDADFVFDVRMLPNPHYERELKPLTGRDAPVIAYLDASPDAQAMRTQIREFLGHWLPKLAQDHRSYVTVAIGCTGGQHRSVYLAEALAQHFANEYNTLRRHREMDATLFAAALR
jgi:RNase adapter protein RapZ